MPQPFGGKGGKRRAELDAGELPAQGEGGNAGGAGAAERVEHHSTEIAGILDRSPSAIRQLAHRAREHVHARRPRYRTDPQVRQQVTERFLAAVMGGDLNALMQALAPDVTVWADGGGMARAAGTHPVHGRDKVARLIIGDAFRHPIPDLSIRYRRVNGEPAALLLSGTTLYMLISLDLIPDGDQVRGIYVVTNPDKLSRLG